MSDQCIIDPAKNCVDVCMGVKASENVLIITDPPRLEMAKRLREEARKLGAYVEIILLPDPSIREIEPLQTPSKILLNAISGSDVILNFFEDFQKEFRPFRTTILIEGKKAGRIGHMIGLDIPSFQRGGLLAECNNVAKYSDLLATVLSKAKRLVIKTGRNLEHELRFDYLGGWHEIGSSDSGILHEKGNFGNLPAGEAFMAISLTCSAHINGTVLVGEYIDQIGFIDFNDPIILDIHNGEVIRIGGRQSDELEENLRIAEAKARSENLQPQYVRKIAEIGIGTNPEAIIGQSTIEVEKRKGTLHIALGDNSMFDGPYEAPNHFDCIIARAILEIDGNVILERGNLESSEVIERLFEESYIRIADLDIDEQAIVTKISQDIDTKNGRLVKKWKNTEGRWHSTPVGDRETSEKAAKLWKKMETQQTLNEILSKSDFNKPTTCQVLRILEEYLLVGIKEKNVIDYIIELREVSGSRFIQLSNLIEDHYNKQIEKMNGQEKIYLENIIEDINAIRDNLEKSNIDEILSKIKRIQYTTDELARPSSKILKSTLTISGGLGPFLNISGEISLENLLRKVRETFQDISNRLH